MKLFEIHGIFKVEHIRLQIFQGQLGMSHTKSVPVVLTITKHCDLEAMSEIKYKFYDL